jgi:Reverse transcriptase (RNA-dependent DNA polymerase)/Retroviral aspartyl protease
LDSLLFVESVYTTEDHVCQALSASDSANQDKVLAIEFCMAGQKGNAFIDSGCTFNAISTAFSKQCDLKKLKYDNVLKCAVGGGNIIELERVVCQCAFDLGDLGSFETQAFILDKIPLQFDAILGMTFLESVNPTIDWQARTLTTTSNKITNNLHHLDKHEDKMLYYMDHDYSSVSGLTRIIEQEEYDKNLAGMHTTIPEHYFFVVLPVNDVDTEKAQRYKIQGWDNLKDNPAYDILLKYKDSVFKEKLEIADVVPKSLVTHNIDLKDDIPIAVKQFRLSPEQQQAVILWTEEMLAAGLIRPSTSPYSSPIFCVKKPVGWRIVHDYRLLNSKTRIPQEPIPRKDAILDAMQGSYHFSCMDLLSGYYQLFLDDASRSCTAFSTPKGHYEYLVIAQGLAGAPATFNRFIQRVFVGLEDIARAFFDDIYIFTRSQEMAAHLTALDQVLQRCQSFGLTIKISKCQFCAPEIPVLGDFVGRQGVRMDPDKVAVIRSWPLPATKTQLRSFLGTIQYSARFCENYGELVAPLHRATIGKKKHEQINLTDEEILSFNALKDAWTRPTLQLVALCSRWMIPGLNEQLRIRAGKCPALNCYTQ